MKTDDFDFDLPPHLIAIHPSSNRGEDRLMNLNKKTGAIDHHSFVEIVKLIPNNALVVFNNSKVRKARLFGQKTTGGKVEVLLIKPLTDQKWLCMVGKGQNQEVGSMFTFDRGVKATIIANLENSLKELEFNHLSDEYLERYGHIPLPPYIKRADQLSDQERYQTVYADPLGSAAAPTAGLHFTKGIINALEIKGVETAYVTLHVGLGTFEPLRTEVLEEHKMHSEHYQISKEVALQINDALQDERPIVAVGTTSLRVLESANVNGVVQAGQGDTSIFIYPGYTFKTINALLTNFHTPKSSLLALVSALAGKENIDKAYQEAIKEEYRFFSYGDAMLIS